jgi:hypothetical protein
MLGSTGAPLGREAGSGAMRYAAAPEPTFEAGQGTELEDT